ncbi:Shikimate O-hydroxycinnamoyltransferase [Hibiscus syriacus]|uniref:Shikimate O-hydroxycinnamoyltransferase n=1 Tax=Hibiscus syriacus TaxID=106335 RepID=A0A6A2X5R1_HIBSY|nr:shikimate O-hydroxycinnamoyltransferase-like [Hibiscus syriacus]KAE8664280.1 Shikimate O-hydroxycinnamoyltransferase [Hibiscus syriacus]
MEVTVKKTTMVTPCEDTPRTSLWVSNIDLVMTVYHISVVYFYKPNGSSDFFDIKVLREALSKVLVSFYPFAGRLGYDENGRLEIVCNAEGVVFSEAETSSVMDDFIQDFSDGSKVPQLAPKFDCSGGISSYPLLGVQVTTFKCGGVSVGVTSQHTVADGPADGHFINSWADMARGMCPTIAPVLDRSFLRARDPPTPKFRHVEFEPSPTLKTVSDPSIHRPSVVSVFKITAAQVKALKDQVDETSGNTKYSTNSILAAHIWRCAVKARDLALDQQIRLTIPIDSRNRLRPPLPPGYFGNAIFYAPLDGLAGEFQSEPFIDTVKKIHEIVNRMDDEYLRSGIDLIETTADVKTVRRGAETMRCPNLSINSWVWLPIQEADFGWGGPVFMRPANIVHEGKVYILPSSTGDGSLTLVTRLETDHVKRFGTLLYSSHKTLWKSSL